MSKLCIMFKKLAKLFVSRSPMYLFSCLCISALILQSRLFVVEPVTFPNILFTLFPVLLCSYVLHILFHISSKIIEFIINLIFVFTSKAYKPKSFKEKLNISSENVCLVFSVEVIRNNLYRIQAYKDFSGVATILYLSFVIIFTVFCSISAVIIANDPPIVTLLSSITNALIYFGFMLPEIVTRTD